MKFNWGTGIVLAFLIMIGGMTYLVSITFRQNDDLVENDYYQKSMNYQKHIEEVHNNDRLAKKIRFQQSPDTLKLSFPRLAKVQEYSGKIHFYSPVEEKRDLTVELKLNNRFLQNISLKSMDIGRYQVKIDWIANKVAYYQEEEIVVKR